MDTPVNPNKPKRTSSWMGIVGGNFLASDFLHRQMKLLVLIMLLAIFYIHNRYAVQQHMIEIDKLKRELAEAKYLALTRNSELMEQSRQSKIEEALARRGSQLGVSTQPPYILK